MIENENAAQAAEEEISVEIVEDPPEGKKQARQTMVMSLNVIQNPFLSG